jgi:hypothetical protein
MTIEEVVTVVTPPHVLGVRVANLGYWLDARGAELCLVAPPAHAGFLQQQIAEVGGTSAMPGDLVLLVRNEPLPEVNRWRVPLWVSKTWELWLDEAERYVFVAPRQVPPRRLVVVDAGFTAGEVLGDFSSTNGEAPYPLQGIEIMLFANWLAGSGDLILHAAGVAVDNRGYCFAGTSGVGKSTLAASFLSSWRAAPDVAATNRSSPVMLGEDQVILRYLDGRFWVFGTPWHVDPAFCSPSGVPLEKLFFLERTSAVGVAPCAPLDGVARLLQTAFVPYYRPAAVSTIMDRLTLLAEQVPFYTLSYQLGADVTQFIRDA